ncbi:hypothetical protein [Pontibacter chitinilyticus]|uniref:hypothetical protein n=1 Tax=Pontibacter chitinilyticus TaxID=2674989 RepID=UPI0032199F24
MRKSILTLLFLGLFATMASAQKEFANLDLPLRHPEDLVTVADGDGNVCIYFFQNGKLNFSLLGPNGQQLAQHEIPYRFSQDPQVLGTRVTDDEFVFYSRYTNGRHEYVRPFAINRNTGAFRSLQDQELDIKRGETFVGGFGNDNHFYMLYTDKKDNLYLYRDAEDDMAHLDLQVFKPDMPKVRDRYGRLADLIYVHPDLERTVYTGYHRSKIYTHGDQVYLVFDGYDLKGKGNKATTEILTLDWNTGKTSYRTLPEIVQKKGPSFNSFLNDNILFRVHLERDQLNLTAYDFNTLQPLKEYNYSGDEEITIKSTPVRQRGTKGLFSSDNTVIEKTSKVMKNLASGVPAITVDKFSDNSIQLTIGSYQPPSDGRNGDQDYSRLVRTPDRYYQTRRGLVMIPGRWTPAYTIPSYYLNSPYYSRYFYDPMGQKSNFPTGPGVSTYFRSILDSNSLAKVESEKAPVLLQDKLEKYEDDLKQEPEYQTVYRYGDKLHYGYYDRKSKTFRIVEFSQNQEEPQPSQQ